MLVEKIARDLVDGDRLVRLPDHRGEPIQYVDQEGLPYRRDVTVRWTHQDSLTLPEDELVAVAVPARGEDPEDAVSDVWRELHFRDIAWFVERGMEKSARARMGDRWVDEWFRERGEA